MGDERDRDERTDEPDVEAHKHWAKPDEQPDVEAHKHWAKPDEQPDDETEDDDTPDVEAHRRPKA